MKTYTIVYRNNLNRESYELGAKKKESEIILFQERYFNDFRIEEEWEGEHPCFATKKEAYKWIKKQSEQSYLEDKKFIEDYTR